MENEWLTRTFLQAWMPLEWEALHALEFKLEWEALPRNRARRIHSGHGSGDPVPIPGSTTRADQLNLMEDLRFDREQSKLRLYSQHHSGETVAFPIVLRIKFLLQAVIWNDVFWLSSINRANPWRVYSSSLWRTWMHWRSQFSQFIKCCSGRFSPCTPAKLIFVHHINNNSRSSCFIACWILVRFHRLCIRSGNHDVCTSILTLLINSPPYIIRKCSRRDRLKESPRFSLDPPWTVSNSFMKFCLSQI